MRLILVVHGYFKVYTLGKPCVKNRSCVTSRLAEMTWVNTDFTRLNQVVTLAR